MTAPRPDAVVLARAIRRLVVRYLEQERPTRKTAVVTSTSPLEVAFVGSDPIEISTVAKGYTPVLNETVVVERVATVAGHGSTWVVVYAIEQL